MDAILIVLVLALNVIISLWNCYAVGTAWKDVMALGSKFEKLVAWSALVQSGVGFSMPILIALTYVTISVLTVGEKPTLTPAEGQQVLQSIFSLWYVAVIFPVIGTGFAITAHSLYIAYQRRDFRSIAIAGWNSFAQIHNTLSAINNLGGAFKNVGALFDGIGRSDDARVKIVAIVIILVIIALASGFMIAFALVRYFANKTQSRLEQYAAQLRA